ncbi:hypothetical protein INT45_002580 [Circinella minor]|uniref:Cytochrome P450 n=1 Tax=Circinella minor TaxID=1195481 RepID=A0A8H7S4U6_9FUNG|nr:hypothetical protein INT45_002580 [Circinella minor]
MVNFIAVPSSSTAICFVKTFVVEQKWVIRLATAVISLYFIYNKITKPPASLRHLPQAGFFTVLSAIKNLKPIDQIAHEISFPAVANSNHGLYVRFDNAGWAVHVMDPVAVKDILMSNDLFPKSITSLQTRRGTLAGRLITGPNILFLSGDHWKKQRKIINPSFHRVLPPKIFGRLSQKMLDTIETEMQIKKDDGKSIDICDITQRWALDVLGEFAFGFKFHALENNGDDNEWVTRYNTIVKAAGNPLYFIFPSIERQFKSWIPGRRKAHEELAKFFGMIHAMADERRQVILNSANTIVDDKQKKHDGEKDVLTLMIEAEHKGQDRLTDEEFESNLSIFFLAGHDTTASAVAFAIYHLAVHPDTQRKAREEVIRIFGDDHSDILPTLEQTRELSYINMNLRINPPAIHMIPRRATQDTELAGVLIPKDTRLSIDVYDLHHNPKVWKNPDLFDPERFAPGGEVDQLSGSGLPWTPFSNGLRSCIGMNFSLMGQRVLLSMLRKPFLFCSRLPR